MASNWWYKVYAVKFDLNPVELVVAMSSNQHKAAIAAILDYWFADIGTGFDLRQQYSIWFSGDETIDHAIARYFGQWVDSALAGQLSGWQSTPEGLLAKVLLLDQFTRNIYRGDARAYDGDEQARQLVKAALANGEDKQLHYVQRSFLYMPLEHSELLQDQEQAVTLFRQLLQEAPAAGKQALSSSLDFALKHRDIIRRFGRFPHRNQVLGRQSTPGEQAYLDAGGSRFGQ